MLGAVRYFFRRLFQPFASAQYFTGIRLYNSGEYESAANAFALIREGVYRTSILYGRLSNFYFYRALRNASILSFYHQDFVHCIRLCQQALDVVPEDRICRNYLAHSFHNVGQYGSAIMQLRTLHDLEPHRDDVLFNLAKINIKAGRVPEGRRILEELIDHNPYYPDFHYVLGIANGKEGELGEAIANLRHAVKLNPCYDMAILLLGLEQIRSHKYREAISTFRQGMSCRAESEGLQHYHDLTIRLSRHLEELDGAEGTGGGGASDTTRRQQRKPTEKLLEEMSSLESKAVEEHSRMLELDISYGEHFTFLDPIYDRPLLRSLVEVFENLTNRFPAYADYYNKLGTFYMKIGDSEQAEAHLRRALKVNPGYVGALKNLSDVLESEGRFEEALEAIDLVLEQGDGDNHKELFIRGRLCVKLKRFEEAAEAMIAATEADPRYAYHLFLLGNILRENNLPEIARRSWEKSQEFLPSLAGNMRKLRNRRHADT